MLKYCEEMTLIFKPNHVIEIVFKVVRGLLSVSVDLRWKIKVFNELKMDQLPTSPSIADGPSSIISEACAHDKMILIWAHIVLRPQQHNMTINVIIPAVLILESL
jgi:hypothetical protein